MLDGNGVLAATYDYDAFGNLTGKTGQANNSITYAGYQWDEETKLYYLNARYYDSTIARFIAESRYHKIKGESMDILQDFLTTEVSYQDIYDEIVRFISSTHIRSGELEGNRFIKKKWII